MCIFVEINLPYANRRLHFVVNMALRVVICTEYSNIMK